MPPHPATLPRLRVVDAGDTVFAPVRTGNAFEEAVERILAAIKLGLIARGGRLPSERELAERLRVSRMTLREAIRSLQEAGYVQTRRGRSGGTFVVEPPPRPARRVRRSLAPEVALDLADALSFRSVLEPGAAELAAAQPHDPQMAARLRALLAETTEAPPQGYRPADSRLHLAIAELTGSPTLVAAVASARMRVNDLLDEMPLLKHNLAHSNRQHERIVRAVLSGDGATARQVMEEHLAASAALLRGFLG
jgi:DNA-binding FadR family transcriptional regulator